MTSAAGGAKTVQPTATFVFRLSTWTRDQRPETKDECPGTLPARPSGVRRSISCLSAQLFSGLFCVATYLFLAAADVAAQTVVWVNGRNVTVNGSVLQKTSGCDGCDDGGAVSQQEVTSGDGYVEFTIGETNTFFLAGLSHGDDGTSYHDIDFAFRFNGAGWADAVENGVYAGADTAYAVGDRFRVAVVNGKVQYSRNGGVLLERSRPIQYPLLLDTALGSVGSTVRDATVATTTTSLPPVSDALIEKAGSQTYRARFTAEQIRKFLPADGAKGKFTFPAPYNTTGVRLTNASDCKEKQDCLWYVGYSYWRNINNHVGSDTMYIFIGTDRARGGRGPTLIQYNKGTDAMKTVGPLFGESSIYSYSTGEGWYFSATRPTALYTFLVGSTQLRRYDVLARTFDASPAMDLSWCPRPAICASDAMAINQPHSSDDDLVHSAAVQDLNWRRIGCVVYREDTRQFLYYAVSTGYIFDECHVDKSGRWLIVLESSTAGSRYNRIVDLTTGSIRTIEDVNGGLGHLDMGFGYAVGADTYNPQANATIRVNLADATTIRPVGPAVHFNKRWDIAAANHIAHGNAQPGALPETQYACGSNASRVADMADEIVCFPLDPNRNLDGSLDVLVVAQTMTTLDAPGGGDDYGKMPKGNLDVTGRYFIWTSNMGGDRLDAFLVKIPADVLMGR